MYFPGIESKSIINSISKEIAISAGSACTTQIVEPSHVLLALGLDEEMTHSSIRIGLGKYTTNAEILFSIQKILLSINHLNNLTL